MNQNFKIQIKEKSSKKKDGASAKPGSSKEAAAAIKNMEKLNERNWLHEVKWFESVKDDIKKFVNHKSLSLTDFECIRIRTLTLEIKKNATATKVTNFEALGLKMNLFSMVVQNSKKHFKLVSEAKTNNRHTRQRPESTQKFAAYLLLADTEKRDFAKVLGEFGVLWAVKYKDNEYAYPSINEVLEGLLMWKAR